MLKIKLFHHLTDGLRSLWSWDYRVALSVAVIAASVSALRITFNLGYNYGIFKYTELTHATCCVGFLESYLIAVTAGLLISAVGLWSQRAAGFFLSLLGLVWIGIVYSLWHISTLSIMYKADIQDFSHFPDQQQHLLTLDSATWWDLVVLSVVITLFIWQIKTLVVILRTSRVKY
jgi:hypothetical protein